VGALITDLEPKPDTHHGSARHTLVWLQVPDSASYVDRGKQAGHEEGSTEGRPGHQPEQPPHDPDP
jgi:hypothetical protein